MYGAVGGSLCMWFIGAYIKIADTANRPEGSPLDSGGIAAIFFFYLWTFFYSKCNPNSCPHVVVVPYANCACV